MTLNMLRKLNRHITIKGITNKSFIKYGRIITGYDFTELIKYGEEKTPIPEEGIVEIFQAKSLNRADAMKNLRNNFFGELDIQVGYCNGNNYKLNYMQYHKSNKALIAVTDLIIFLGKVQDIKGEQYESNRTEIFFIPEGVAIEVYSNTLYSLPCNIDERGFKTIVLSIKGSNSTIKESRQGEPLLHSKNRWLIAHEDARSFINSETQLGIVGENLEIFIK